MSFIIEEFLSEDRISQIPEDIVWADNPIVLGLILGRCSAEFLPAYLSISECPSVDPSLRSAAILTILKLHINAMWLERVSSILPHLPETPVKQEVISTLLKVFSGISENTKHSLDFIWVVRASLYLTPWIGNNSIILFADCVGGALDTEGLLRVILEGSEIICSQKITYKEPVVCWVGKCVSEYINAARDKKDIKKVSEQIRNIVRVLGRNEKIEIEQRYLECCRRLDIDIDGETVEIMRKEEQGLESGDMESYNNMKEVTVGINSSALREFREVQRIDFKNLSDMLKEISDQNQNVLYFILNELWEKNKTNFYLKKPWKLILKALKFGKVLREHHHMFLEESIYKRNGDFSHDRY